jgi:predicted NUDIX family NTP pyrophosphohydrolase
VAKADNFSAGLIMFRRKPALQVLLAHPGGPFWKNKDEGAWTIPKGQRPICIEVEATVAVCRHNCRRTL